MRPSPDSVLVLVVCFLVISFCPMKFLDQWHTALQLRRKDRFSGLCEKRPHLQSPKSLKNESHTPQNLRYNHRLMRSKKSKKNLWLALQNEEKKERALQLRRKDRFSGLCEKRRREQTTFLKHHSVGEQTTCSCRAGGKTLCSCRAGGTTFLKHHFQRI